jgi:MFS family permease
LTPAYASIGIAAPILVVLFRLLQGFALGGEVGPSTAFMLEAAPQEKRGLYVSLQATTQQAAILLSGLVGLTLSSLMSAAQLESWGWRIAMLIGASIVPFGLIMRRRLPESLAETSSARLPQLNRREAWQALCGIFILAAITISTYIMTYMVTFAIRTLGLSSRIAFGATVTTALCGILFNPVGGWLSDRFGRKPVMLVSLALLLAVTLPSFMVMTALKTPAVVFASTALMGTFLALGTSTILVIVSENLPAASRSGGIAISYALAISIFGGSTQFIVTWLIGALNTPLAPAWYMSGAIVIGIIAMLAMPVRKAA